MEEMPGDRLVEQAFDLWIEPEVRRRRETGRVPGDFTLTAAQVIFNLDAAAPSVRLNQEVQALLKVRAARPIEKGEAIPFTEDAIAEIISSELTDLDPNAGHVTMILYGGTWHLYFDFRYNASRVSGTIGAAREFLDCAALCLGKHYFRAFIDNLFSATELMAKGELLLLPDKSMLGGKRHTFISSKFNRRGKLGNAEKRYVALLNRLSELRTSARYSSEDFTFNEAEARRLLATAEGMFPAVRKNVPTRFRLSGQ